MTKQERTSNSQFRRYLIQVWLFFLFLKFITTTFTKQSPFQDVNSGSANHKIPRNLWKSKVHYLLKTTFDEWIQTTSSHLIAYTHTLRI